MYKNIDFYAFRNEFNGSGYENNFSAEGLSGLFDYLENLEEETGEQIELDVVALCCDYTEFDSLEDFNNENDYDYTLEELKDVTDVVYSSATSLVIKNF